MTQTTLATEPTKTALENTVSWYLSDKLSDPATTIATKKYLTPDNQLVYLTRCNVAETAVPRIKVQVLRRVDGGIQETGYQLFDDHRLQKYRNDMVFGAQALESTPDQGEPVVEADAQQLLQLVNSLQTARHTL